jgi:phosphohistidine phosphatase SixA
MTTSAVSSAAIVAIGWVLGTMGAAAQSPQTTAPEKLLTGSALVSALREGGYVIVLRHASSPPKPPAKDAADPENVKLERQLDEAGRAGASGIGKALKDLKIPVGEVLSSPAYRALETAKLAQLPNPQTHEELGDRGHSMQGVSETDAAWLRDRTRTRKAGNTVIVTHMPNIARAFPEISGLTDGEALVLRPDGKGGAVLAARIKIQDWASLEQDVAPVVKE